MASKRLKGILTPIAVDASAGIWPHQQALHISLYLPPPPL